MAQPLIAGSTEDCGFSLIELICTLVIIGTLSAVALPRYMDLSQAAHRAAVSGTMAAFRTSVFLASIGCTLRSWAGCDNLPGYGNGAVDFNTACFPTDTTGNANTIASNATRCTRVWNAILARAPSITTAAAGADFRATAANQICTFRYLKDPSVPRLFAYDSRNGAVVTIDNP